VKLSEVNPNAGLAESSTGITKMTTREQNQNGSVLSKTVQIDRSGGQGHCWRIADVSGDIAEEIAAEMLDGGKEECDDYIASNGCHYRWS
jgi:hypothetical protein